LYLINQILLIAVWAAIVFGLVYFQQPAGRDTVEIDALTSKKTPRRQELSTLESISKPIGGPVPTDQIP
jgi:hypothetical protein